MCTQVEAGSPQPCRHDVLGTMAGLEHAQRARIELATLVFRDGKIIVLDLAQALAAKSGRADVVPRRLRAISGDERLVDRRVDGEANAGCSARGLILAAGLVIEVDHPAYLRKACRR